MVMTLPSLYAIQALTYLAAQPPGKLSGTRDIAAHEGIPGAFLGKVLLQLRHSHLVRSYRGTGGGYELGAPAEKINLLSIIQCIEGAGVLRQCGLENHDCTAEHPCALHTGWKPIQDRIVQFFEGATLDQMVRARQAAKGGLQSEGVVGPTDLTLQKLV